MIHRKLSVFLAALLFIALLVSGCGVNKAATDETAQGYVSEIDKTKVLSFYISVDETDWQTMLDNAENEEYISADVTINDTTIRNVGIRPKGNSSLMSVARDETTDRFSFKIKFDEYVDGQTWLGLDKIVINNMFSDATYMKEYLSYDIMSSVGVNAPLYAFADIQVNSKTWGLYLAVEDLEDSYLDRAYNGEGELYKPESTGGQAGNIQGNFGGGQMPPDFQYGNFPQNSTGTPGFSGGSFAGSTPPQGNFGGGNFPQGGMGGFGGMAQSGVSLQYTDDSISSYSAIFDSAQTDADEHDYQRVITALKNLSTGTDLETYVDVDAVLKYFAAHTVVVNLDSYISTMGHNYYLYENDGRITILPWDYNLAFGGFQSGSAADVVNFPIDTPVSGVEMAARPLLNKLLEVPEYTEKYHAYLQQIIDEYFSGGKFEQKVAQLHELISSYVKNDPSAFYTYDDYLAAVDTLKALGSLRAESIQGQLDGTIPSTTEGQKNNPNTLIDAASVDLAVLGGQGGGKNMMQNPGWAKPADNRATPG